jgi:hypothetical protein
LALTVLDLEMAPLWMVDKTIRNEEKKPKGKQRILLQKRHAIMAATAPLKQ